MCSGRRGRTVAAAMSFMGGYTVNDCKISSDAAAWGFCFPVALASKLGILRLEPRGCQAKPGKRYNDSEDGGEVLTDISQYELCIEGKGNEKLERADKKPPHEAFEFTGMVLKILAAAADCFLTEYTAHIVTALIALYYESLRLLRATSESSPPAVSPKAPRQRAGVCTTIDTLATLFLRDTTTYKRKWKRSKKPEMTTVTTVERDIRIVNVVIRFHSSAAAHRFFADEKTTPVVLSGSGRARKPGLGSGQQGSGSMLNARPDPEGGVGVGSGRGRGNRWDAGLTDQLLLLNYYLCPRYARNDFLIQNSMIRSWGHAFMPPTELKFGRTESLTRPATLLEVGPGSGRGRAQKPGLGSGRGSATRPRTTLHSRRRRRINPGPPHCPPHASPLMERRRVGRVVPQIPPPVPPPAAPHQERKRERAWYTACVVFAEAVQGRADIGFDGVARLGGCVPRVSRRTAVGAEVVRRGNETSALTLARQRSGRHYAVTAGFVFVFLMTRSWRWSVGERWDGMEPRSAACPPPPSFSLGERDILTCNISPRTRMVWVLHDRPAYAGIGVFGGRVGQRFSVMALVSGCLVRVEDAACVSECLVGIRVWWRRDADEAGERQYAGSGFVSVVDGDGASSRDRPARLSGSECGGGGGEKRGGGRWEECRRHGERQYAVTVHSVFGLASTTLLPGVAATASQSLPPRFFVCPLLCSHSALLVHELTRTSPAHAELEGGGWEK
ncbi:hypothetical protein R3P38DRAFT_3547450 [Favolaschia claudopus]|uniref:Uncharacterized protein n=1 Tax=Favolaschia claudopus TaxID=2862362 RepID=A0AAW0E592_9AGAR